MLKIINKELQATDIVAISSQRRSLYYSLMNAPDTIQTLHTFLTKE